MNMCAPHSNFLWLFFLALQTWSQYSRQTDRKGDRRMKKLQMPSYWTAKLQQ